MKTKKIMVSLLSTLAMLGGLVSCGRTNTASDSSAGSTPTSYETVIPSAKPTSKVSLEFWHTSGQTVIDAFQNIIDDFTALVKKNEGVDVSIDLKYQGGYSDILNKINKGFSTGNYPTLAIAYPDHVATYLQDEGENYGKYVVDMSKYINDENIGFGKESYLEDGPASDFVDAFYSEGSGYVRNGIYSLPVMKSSEALYYNKDKVKQYAPQFSTSVTGDDESVENYMNHISWDELINFCRFIKEKEASNKTSTLETPFIYDSDSNLIISKMYQNNAPFISINDGKGSVDFDNDQAKAIVTKLKSEHDEGLLDTKGTTGEYASNAFTSEKCFFTVGSTGGAGYNYPTGDSFTVGVAPVPCDNNNPKYVTQGLTATILRTNDDKDGYKALYGYKFLKYLTSAEVNADLCVNGSEGYSPVRKSAYTTDLYSEYLSDAETTTDFMPKVAKVVYTDINGKYLTTPCFSGSATARDQVGGIVTQVLLGNKSVDEAFSDAVNQTKLAM